MAAETPGLHDGTVYVPVETQGTMPFLAEEDLADAFWFDQRPQGL